MRVFLIVFSFFVLRSPLAEASNPFRGDFPSTPKAPCMQAWHAWAEPMNKKSSFNTPLIENFEITLDSSAHQIVASDFAIEAVVEKYNENRKKNTFSSRSLRETIEILNATPVLPCVRDHAGSKLLYRPDGTEIKAEFCAENFLRYARFLEKKALVSKGKVISSQKTFGRIPSAYFVKGLYEDGHQFPRPTFLNERINDQETIQKPAVLIPALAGDVSKLPSGDLLEPGIILNQVHYPVGSLQYVNYLHSLIFKGNI